MHACWMEHFSGRGWKSPLGVGLACPRSKPLTRFESSGQGVTGRKDRETRGLAWDATLRLWTLISTGSPLVSQNLLQNVHRFATGYSIWRSNASRTLRRTRRQPLNLTQRSFVSRRLYTLTASGRRPQAVRHRIVTIVAAQDVRDVTEQLQCRAPQAARLGFVANAKRSASDQRRAFDYREPLF